MVPVDGLSHGCIPQQQRHLAPCTRQHMSQRCSPASSAVHRDHGILQRYRGMTPLFRAAPELFPLRPKSGVSFLFTRGDTLQKLPAPRP